MNRKNLLTEPDEIGEFEKDLAHQVLRDAYGKDAIVLFKTYQKATEVVKLFCNQFPHVEPKLNKLYLELFEIIDEKVEYIRDEFIELRDNNQLPYDCSQPANILNDFYYKPFSNLFTAEKELQEQKGYESKDRRINWPFIRTRMQNFIGKLGAIIKSKKGLKSVSSPKYKDVIAKTKKYLSSHPIQHVSQKQRKINVFENWPSEFKWSDASANFLLGDKKLIFGARKSTRKKVFEMLVSKKGKWTYTNEMAKETGTDKKYIKSVIHQLRKKIGKHDLNKLIKIKASGDVSKPSAYRLIAYPNR